MIQSFWRLVECETGQVGSYCSDTRREEGSVVEEMVGCGQSLVMV